MQLSRYGPWMGLATLAGLAAAGPVAMDLTVPLNQAATDLMVREALAETVRTPHLEKRLTADFSMEKSWKNEVLFSGSWINNDEGVAKGVSLAVTCLDCYTRGIVTAALAEDILKPTVKLSFSGVEAYVDMGVAVTAGATYAINLFASQSPIGLGFPGLSVGVVFYVDLVFSLSSEIDLEGGFYVKVADGAFLEASVFGGEVVDSFFDGLSSKSLPVIVKTGRATFKADLRVRVQCGAEADVDIFGIGAGAVMGVYANLIEFVAVLETTPTCPLQSREWWDLNVGAYAHLDVVVDFKTIGLVPTVSTTLLSAPTMTQCWLSGESGGGGGGGGAPAPTYSTETVTLSPAPVQSLSGDAPTFPVFTPMTPTGVAFGPVVTIDTSQASGSSSSSSTTTFPYARGNATNSSYPITTAAALSSSDADPAAPTLRSTATYSLIRCAADVVNCPLEYQSRVVVTQTIDVVGTTTCTSPRASGGGGGALPRPSDKPTATLVHVITDVVVLVPCPTPYVETFVPPSLLVPTQSAIASTFPAAPATLVPTLVVPAPSSLFPAVAPFVGGAAKEVAYAPVLSSSASSKTAAAAAQVTARPSASYVAGGNPGGKPVTAGAPGPKAASVCSAIVAMAGLLLVL